MLIQRWALLDNCIFFRSRHQFHIQDKVPRVWDSSNINKQKVPAKPKLQDFHHQQRKVTSITYHMYLHLSSIHCWWIICSRLTLAPLFTIIQIRIATGTIIPQIQRIKSLETISSSSKSWSRIAKLRGQVERDQIVMQRIRALLNSKKCITTHHISSILQSCRKLFIISQSHSHQQLWIKTL